jgi:NTP pyrophosphatase (non-canonical NTP hydrolase)
MHYRLGSIGQKTIAVRDVDHEAVNLTWGHNSLVEIVGKHRVAITPVHVTLSETLEKMLLDASKAIEEWVKKELVSENPVSAKIPNQVIIDLYSPTSFSILALWCTEPYGVEEFTVGESKSEILSTLVKEMFPWHTKGYKEGTSFILPAITLSLNEWAKRIHQNSVAKGWWQEEPSENVLGSICSSIHGEVSELWEDYRRKRLHEPSSHSGLALTRIEEELADILIRTLGTAKAYGVDIEKAVRLKCEYNKKRPFRHGDLNGF